MAAGIGGASFLEVLSRIAWAAGQGILVACKGLLMASFGEFGSSSSC